MMSELDCRTCSTWNYLSCNNDELLEECLSVPLLRVNELFHWMADFWMREILCFYIAHKYKSCLSWIRSFREMVIQTNFN